MNMKNILKLLIILIIMINIASIHATDNSSEILNEQNKYDIYVDSNIGNDSFTGESWQTPVKTIEKAINISNTNSTINIYLNNGTFNGNNNTQLTISNKNTINIIGSANTIIDGENKNNIFTITNNTKITLQNIQFINAYINNTISKGPAINLENNTEILIENCRFINNTAEGEQVSGGAINIENTEKTTIKNNEFKNNTINLYNNTYSAYGGAINLKNNTIIKIENNTLTQNNIKRNTNIPFEIKTTINMLWDNRKNTGSFVSYNTHNCTILEKINSYGKAININNSERLEIINNIIINNSNSSGDTLHINNTKNIIFYNNTISNNTSTKLTLTKINPNTMFLDIVNFILTTNGTVNIENSENLKIIDNTLKNNIIENGNGGAFYIENINQTTIKNNTLTNNTALCGGAILINNCNQTEIKENKLSNNKATYKDKSIVSCQTYNEIDYLTIIENAKLANLKVYTSIESQEYYDYAKEIFKNKLAYRINIVKGTVATGGAVHIENSNKTKINNNTFLENYATAGGSIYITNSKKIEINNTIIKNNTAFWYRISGWNDIYMSGQGIIYLNNTTASIENCNITGNYMNLAITDYLTTFSIIQIENSNTTIKNTHFTKNKVPCGTIQNNGYTEIFNCTFQENIGKHEAPTIEATIKYEKGNGADIHNKGYCNIINTTFKNTKVNAGSIGGSIYNNGTIILKNIEISGIKSLHVGHAVGAAIANIGNLTIIDSTIKDNIIRSTYNTRFQGTIHNEGLLTARRTIFMNNTALNGGEHPTNEGIDVKSLDTGSGNIYNLGGTLNITECIFINPQQGILYHDIANLGGTIISLENNYWNGVNPNIYRNTNANIQKYIILSAEPEYSALKINESMNITAKFLSNTLQELKDIKLPFEKLNLTFKTKVNGENIEITKKPINNTATFIFNWTQEKGTFPSNITYGIECKPLIVTYQERIIIKTPITPSKDILIEVGKDFTNMNVEVKNITYGENITVKINITGNASHQPTGNISIYLLNYEGYQTLNKYITHITNGQAELSFQYKGLDKYMLKIVYEGDELYCKNYTRTYVSIGVKLNMTLPESIYVDEALIINISKTPKSPNTKGTIYVDGKKFSTVSYNKDNITLTYKNYKRFQTEGTYNITITYNINNYETSTSKMLIIKRHETNLTLNASDIMIGQNLLINMSITPEEVGGEVNITINNQTLTPAYINGTKTWTYNITNLKAGTYNITATFNGNKKYAPTTITKTITVHRYPSNLTVKQTINDNLTGTITTQAQGTGNITVWINNKKYTQKNNNTNIFNVEYINGTNYIYIHYTGDDTYDSATWNTTMNITYKYFLKAENITYYQNEEFNYTITLLDGKLKPLDDYVNITFNNTQYKIKTVNGTIQFPLKLPKGTYNITIQYNQSTITNTINITTADTNPNMTIKTNNITYTEKLQVTINITKGATGTITIKIHNQTQTIKIQNNKVTATFENIPAGNQTVTATYNGDNKYRIITENKTIQIKKAQSTIKITTGNITIGENIFIYATTNKGTTGNVTFRIIGQYSPRNRTLENNKATWYISPLNRGQYTITATYCGDNNYNPSNTTYTITLDPEINLTINTQDTEYGEEILIQANVNPELKGQINLQIDDINQNVTIENGKATLKIPELNAGTYNIKATFLSENFQSQTTTHNLTIKPTNPISDIYIKDILAGEDEIIQITLKNDSLKYKIFIDNKQYNKLNITIPKLTKGEHTLTVEVTGNNNYKNQTQTIKFYAKTQTSTINITTQNITYHENLIIKAAITENATGTITYKIANTTITTQDKEISIKNLAAGTYTLTVTYNGDSYYQSSNTTTTITVYKTTPTMNVELNASTPEDPVNITVKINTDATGNITYRIYGLYSPRNKTIINGQSNWLIEPLEMGEYELIVIYNGDDNYNPTNITKIININQIKSYLTHNITINPDNSLTVTAELTTTENDTINTDITLRIGNKFYKMKITNNTGLFTTPELTPGNYRYSLAYAGTTEISSSNNNGEFTIKETVTLESNTTVNNNTATIQIHSSKDNINITLTINNTEYPITIKNNTATIQIDLKPGQYTYTIKYDGNELAKTANTTGTFTIKQTPEITYTLEINPDNSITLHINSTIKDTNLTLEINGKNYLIKITNGTGLYTTPELNPDNYTYHIIYDGDKLTKGIEKSGQFELKNNAQLDVKNLTKYYSSTDRLNMTLTQKNRPIANETIYITINGVTYKRTTNTEGKISMAINLASGNYTATITFNNTQYNPITKNIQINIKNTIYGDDITKVYKNDTQYYAIFTDNTGKLLKNTTVTFNINGVFYQRTTNQEGIAKLNINLQQGTYILTATNPLTNEQYSNTITVLSKIQENSDLTKYYRNSSQYTVKIIKSNGQTAGTGEKVTFNINGVFYERYTDENGYAKLNINLQPGDYIITAEYDGCKVSNNITVLTILKAYNLAKKYGTTIPFTATLLNGEGNPLANEKITFNINGVFYQRTTNNQGMAKLNINLQQGKYIITSSYNGLNVANVVTVH